MNPAVVGVLIVMLGGVAGAVFYLPFKKVQGWAWESYWMIYALVGLIVVPWALALTTSPNVLSVLSKTDPTVLLFCFLCGVMWGFGGLTWGMMMRYLGFGLGLALGAGILSSVGTLVPMAIKGELGKLVTPGAGVTSLIGILMSFLGIVMVGLAGMSKEGEVSEEEKKKAVAEFNFKKGVLFAIFSGVMSAGMFFGLTGGPAIEDMAQKLQPATSASWKGMPVLVVVLLGGFVVNALWCLFLNLRNKTLGDYTKKATPLAGNYVFAALAGAIWCSQFICFKTGEPRLGEMKYVEPAVLMASAILFGSLLGIYLGEWKGTSPRTRSLLGAGLVLLLLSSVVVSYSGYLAEQEKPAGTTAAPTKAAARLAPGVRPPV